MFAVIAALMVFKSTVEVLVQAVIIVAVARGNSRSSCRKSSGSIAVV